MEYTSSKKMSKKFAMAHANQCLRGKSCCCCCYCCCCCAVIPFLLPQQHNEEFWRGTLIDIQIPLLWSQSYQTFFFVNAQICRFRCSACTFHIVSAVFLTLQTIKLNSKNRKTKKNKLWQDLLLITIKDSLTKLIHIVLPLLWQSMLPIF